jgi:hypothetical protein
MNERRPVTGSAPEPDASGDLMDVARLAYIYGFPAYEMARLRFRALAQPGEGSPARLNAFRHDKAPTVPTTSRVTTSNADMLKSSAWLDLSRTPLVIHVPQAADRYFSLALMDFFTNNFAVLGQRTKGTAAGDFFLVGPQWKGTAPAGMAALRAPTNGVWALVRILVHGPDDLAKVRALQDQFTVSPPSGRAGETASGGLDPLSLPEASFDSTKPLRFFDVLNAVLSENPPPAEDKAVLDQLRTIGIGPSLKFKRRDFTAPQLRALRQGLASGRDALRARAPQQVGPRRWPSDTLLARLRGPEDPSRDQLHGGQRGWSRPPPTVGDFGTDYLLRARCGLRGIGGLPVEDAMYFITGTDAAGVRLGAGRYSLRFPPGGSPPVDAYWSLTAYRTDENNRRWLVPNAIDRYSVGSHMPDLAYGDDGSLEIFVQHDRPVANEENWLPAPDGHFVLTLRAYQPRRELLEGRYAIPEVVRRRSVSG